MSKRPHKTKTDEAPASDVAVIEFDAPEGETLTEGTVVADYSAPPTAPEDSAFETDVVFDSDNDGAHVELVQSEPDQGPTTDVSAESVTIESTAEDAAQDDAFTNERAVAGNNSKDLKRDRAKVLAEARKLGTDKGNGSKSLVALALLVTQKAMDGSVVPQTTVGTTTIPGDAEPIYRAFRDQAAKAAGHFAAKEQDDASLKVNVSKINAFLRLGVLAERINPNEDDESGFLDAVDLMTRAMELHIQYLGGTEKKNLKVKSTYEALLTVARAQMNDEKLGGHWMHSEALSGLLLHEDSEPKVVTGLDLLKAGLEKLEYARVGKPDTEKRAGRAAIEEVELDNAIGWTLQLVAKLDPAWVAKREKDEADRQAKLAENAAKKNKKKTDAPAA